MVLANSIDLSREQGFIGRIPVRNVWLLMLYASELFRTLGKSNVSLEESPDDLPDLVAEILAHAVEQRQRRHLSMGYQPRKATLSRVRGRIDVLTTERQQLLSRGLVACRFDELTVDTPRNRFVRAALETISRLVRSNALVHRCRKLASDMKRLGVSSNLPTKAQLNADRLVSCHADDRVMIAAALLAFDLALPTQSQGSNALPSPDREQHWARKLFEKAVGGFYEVCLTSQGWKVTHGHTLLWPIEQRTQGIQDILPTMRTDIVLEQANARRRIVIDTKFTSILTKGWYREQTLRNAYLYQIYAYLRSQVNQGDPLADNAAGLLLHPSLGDTVDEAVVMQGHCIRFATVDLAASSHDIRARLLFFVSLDAKASPLRIGTH